MPDARHAAHPPPAPPGLGAKVLRTALALLALVVLQIVLTLPGGRDPETFLALVGAEREELLAVREAWSRLVVLAAGPLQASLADAARLYWLLDTALFMPLYGWLMFELARRLLPLPVHPDLRRLAAGLPWLVLALLAVDLVENSGALARLAARGEDGAARAAGAAGAALLAALAAAAGAWFWQRRLGGATLLDAMAATASQAAAAAASRGAAPAPAEPHGAAPASARAAVTSAQRVGRLVLGLARFVPPFAPRWVRPVMAAAAVLSLVLVAAQVFAPGAALTAGAWVHGAKRALVLAIVVVAVVVGVRWLWREGQNEDRAALRRGLGDILWRTRYVLVTLALLGAMTLVLDQCRDVAIGVADGLFVWPQALWAWPVMALSVLAVWALSFSCWLWTRLACRMPSPGASPAGAQHIDDMLGQAARGAARMLGIAPTFVVAVMSALAARDAVWAGTPDEGGWLVAPVALLLLGLACVLGGWLFLWGREQEAAPAAPRSAGGSPAVQPVGENALPRARDYYNDPLLGPPHDWMASVGQEKYRFVAGRGPGPAALPIVALALAVGLRCLAVAVEPGVSLAFVVIVLSLVGWLGFFGWLSMKEQREARPWLLVLLAAAGALGLFGLTDNHTVRIAREGGAAAALPALVWQIGGTLALAALLLGMAWLLVHRGLWARWPKVLAVTGAAAVGLLAFVDRAGAPPAAAGGVAHAQPLTIEQQFEKWAAAAWRNGQGEPPARVLLVASEGGGVRAAYWTARVLAELERALPQFERQLLVLSGVSGGAVGEAVFAGCPRGEVDACVRRFGEADLLTPLLGAWMFEDLLARVLPSSLPHNRWFNGYCSQAGCGFLSRGLWFEQALERAVPGLARGITAAAADGPWLLLNATWVETGDRAIASGVGADWQADRFANARDQIAFAARGDRTGADMPLSAAAHNAARFPFVNAIGRLRDGHGEQGHLADGGYFDNAGAQSTIDVLARLRRWIAEQPECAQGNEPCRQRLAWLRALKPRVVVVQNGVPDACDAGPPRQRLDCMKRIWRRQSDPPPDRYEPAEPSTAGRWRLFVDGLGPLVTLVNVAGTGSNGRRAEALLKRECQRFGPGNEACVLRIAQRTDGGVLYPLGWYLSPTARRALDAQAKARVREAMPMLVH